MAKSSKINFYPVILAGGRGTRFWPLSRRKFAKQLLPLNSEQSMIQETVERLLPLAPADQSWIITNSDLRPAITRQLKALPKRQIVAEPVGRNTAPAIGLAAFLLYRKDPKAVLGLFPSDQVVAKHARFRRDLKQGIKLAAAGDNIVVLGVKPTRPETGYGYIETGAASGDAGVLRVRRFREKPAEGLARKFVAEGNYYWNSGIFLWSAQTLVDALKKYLPETATLLEKIAATWGTAKFESTLKRLYPKCQDKSVDYGILEPRSAAGEAGAGIYCIPADWGWNDLGSWTAHFEHRLAQGVQKDNVIKSASSFTHDAHGNYLHAPGKFVAAVGVSGLVVVETADALLITTLERAQDVGKIVKYLDAQKNSKLT
jgi:mannose-1-phosphate guanylyltransferase